MPKKLTSTLRVIYTLKALALLIVIYLAYGFVNAVTVRTFDLLAIERAHTLSRITYNVITSTTFDNRAKVAEMIRDFRQWEATQDYFPSVEIYPVNPQTGDSYFPSILTGKLSQDSLKNFNSTSSDVTRTYVKDHRNSWVFRISGLANVGLYSVTVNADVDVWDVLKAHGVRLMLHGVLIIIVLVNLFYVKRVKGSAARDQFEDSMMTGALSRILAEAMEELEVDVCVAEIADDGGQNKIIHTTRGFANRMGYDSQNEELKNQPLEIFLPKEKREEHKDWVANILSGDEFVTESRFVNAVKKDGSLTPVNLLPRRTAPVRGRRYAVASIR